MAFNLNGFVQGLNGGLTFGQRINDAIDQNEIAKIRAQGIAEARAAQQSGTPQVVDNQELSSTPQASGITSVPLAPNTDLNTFVQGQQPTAPIDQGDGVTTLPVAAPSTTDSSVLSSTPMASADPNTPASPASTGITIKGDKRFRVGQQSFDSIDDAKAAAAKQAPDMNQLMREKLVPKMTEAYLAQGNIDKADAWQKWSDDGTGKAKMQSWADAFSAAQNGNYDDAAKALQKLHGHLDDGNTISSTEPVKDKAGNTTGFNVNYTNDQTGEKKAQFVDKDTLVQQGLSALSPQAMFEQQWKQQSSADTLKAKAAIDAQNDQRTAQLQDKKDADTAKRQTANKLLDQSHDEKMEAIKHANRTDEQAASDTRELANIAPKEQAKAQARIQILRESGADEDTIKAAIQSNFGGDSLFKKPTSPSERRDMVLMELQKNPLYTAAKDDKRAQMKAAALADFPDTAAPSAASKPASSKSASSAPAAGGLMIYDPVSKQMVPAARR